MGNNDGNYNTAAPDRYLLLKSCAQTNKCFQTDAERLLWEHIRAKQLSVKFNRQHIIGDFIVDFVCIEKGLVITKASPFTIVPSYCSISYPFN